MAMTGIFAPANLAQQNGVTADTALTSYVPSGSNPASAPGYFNPLVYGSYGGQPLLGGGGGGANSGLGSAVLNPSTGLYVSSTTGAAWTGNITLPNGTTQKAQNGQLLPTDQYGNPLPVLTPITTPKQPGIQAAATGLLNTADANAATLSTSFNDYLQQANAINAQGAQQLSVDQAAVDPTATINRLNNDTANTTNTVNADVANEDAALDTEDNNYAQQQAGVQSDVAAENTNAAATTQQRIAALSTNLQNEDQAYETASQNVANQAFNTAEKGISLYQLGTGTPTSASGNLSNRYINAYEDVNVPLQQQLAQNQIQQTQYLDTQQQQADQQAYQNLINQYSGQSALNQNLQQVNTGNTTYQGQLGTSTAEYTGGLDAATAAQIQQLKVATAGMSRAQAATYLQQLQIPLNVGQQVLAGEISNVAGVQNLENQANYYTLSSPYTGANVPGAPFYNTSTPRNRYTPTAPTAPVVPGVPGAPGSGIPPTAPVGTTTQIGGGYVQDSQGNIWLNGALVQQGAPLAAPVNPNLAAPGSNGTAGLVYAGGGLYTDTYGNIYNSQGQLIPDSENLNAVSPNDYGNTAPVSSGSFNNYSYSSPISDAGTDDAWDDSDEDDSDEGD
jgi:hypothetical protein